MHTEGDSKGGSLWKSDSTPHARAASTAHTMGEVRGVAHGGKTPHKTLDSPDVPVSMRAPPVARAREAALGACRPPRHGCAEGETLAAAQTRSGAQRLFARIHGDTAWPVPRAPARPTNIVVARGACA